MPRKKKRDHNRSQIVREYMMQHPGASTAEIAAEMEKRGQPVSTTLIYNIKSYDKRKGGTKRRRRKSAPASNGAPISASAGGMSKAEHIRQTLRELGRRTRPRDVVAHLENQG